ncbi:MAG: exodeoxyribonuclease VII large subunit [Thermodesulfobacteriales bacterium]|nr:MAG: exodeoxyribonuclease VII large subunit [Thermodesulfobacteriales bacterium]
MTDHPSFKELLSEKIFTVSEINARIKETIEEEIGFEYVWIVGEISNFKGNYASGHWYFSLKDNETQISAVCFKWANQYIKFLPENGMEVILCGQISVYEKQGSYQVNVRNVEPKGVGAQALALEQLKEKLLKEGLFDEDRKRLLPYLPQRIGIVTSPTGAAVKDILKVLDRRFPNLDILISPARVQGDEAPADIISALGKLYKVKDIELIIVARGGGSKEDLWAFNDEGVAREIAKSPVAVISAVGHEIDITIADLVADVRAATPSMAAEIAVREKFELKEDLIYFKEQIALALTNRIELYAREVDQLQSEFVYTFQSKLDSASSEFLNLAGNLDALSPLKVLQRGYSITQKLPKKVIVKDSSKLKKGDEVLVSFSKGEATCTVKETKN